MSRFWAIAPFESRQPDEFDRVWQYDISNNVISVGWKSLGDMSQMSRQDLSQAIEARYPDKRLSTRSLWANMIWAFYHEIKVGDFVIARRGLKTLAGVGRVDGSAYYSAGKCPFHGHPNFLDVAWQDVPRNKAFPGLVFQRPTLAELSEDQFRRLVEGTGPPPELPDPNIQVEDPNEFVLEKYLEDFIVSNFESIFKGRMKVYAEAEEDEGQQYDTNEIGRIDILAVEETTNSFVVIELKKGRPSDKVVGQTLRYMGWVKKNLCAEGQGVRGLVICRDHDPKLTYALDMTKDIDVRYYNVSFKLKETP